MALLLLQWFHVHLHVDLFFWFAAITWNLYYDKLLPFTLHLCMNCISAFALRIDAWLMNWWIKNCVLNMAEVVSRPIRYLQSFKNTARTSVLRRARLFAAELAKMVDMWRFLENSHSSANKTHKFLFIYCTMVLPWKERLHKNLVILCYPISIMQYCLSCTIDA